MKELDKEIKAVESYRTPQFKLTELLKSIFTLGMVKQKRMSEAASLYIFEYNEADIYVIYSEEMSGKRENVIEFKMHPSELKKIVFEDKKIVYDHYVYHFDLDTVVFRES